MPATAADQGDERDAEQRRARADAVARPADELGDQRHGGREQRDLLRCGVAEGEVHQRVEPGEAEGAEEHHLDAAPLGGQGGDPLAGQQQGEQHLKVLREAGMTRTRDAGTTRYVRLRREEMDRIYPGLLDAVLAERGEVA
ncbi:helix-turn-helix domain-containing protein [Micromonospora sp. NPDC005223]|uniref:helix-turn-helix domain-containing protein n=1 Tax=unclassified Micromonospora TaxID=2617518 RepID=UPI0033CB96E4